MICALFSNPISKDPEKSVDEEGSAALSEPALCFVKWEDISVTPILKKLPFFSSDLYCNPKLLKVKSTLL